MIEIDPTGNNKKRNQPSYLSCSFEIGEIGEIGDKQIKKSKPISPHVSSLLLRGALTKGTRSET